MGLSRASNSHTDSVTVADNLHQNSFNDIIIVLNVTCTEKLNYNNTINT